MNRISSIFNNTQQGVSIIENSAAASSSTQPVSPRLGNHQDLRQASATSPLRQSQVQKSQVQKSVAEEQLKNWAEQGTLLKNSATLDYPHGNEKIAKNIRQDIANAILKQGKRADDKVILKGIDLPGALNQIAHAITGDSQNLGFIPEKLSHLSCSHILPSEGSYLVSYDKSRKNLIHFAAMHGYNDGISCLTALGVDFDMPAHMPAMDYDDRAALDDTPPLDYCETPLHIAIQNGHKDAMQNLLKLGADTNAWRGDGETPLHIAAKNGDIDVIRTLIKAGATVNATMMFDNATPLHIAAQHGNSDAVRILIEAGANVNATMKNGATPLHIAAQYGHNDAILILVKEGNANVNATMKNGATPFRIAAHHGHTNTLHTLIELGAYVYRPNQKGKTPVMATKGRPHQYKPRKKSLQRNLSHPWNGTATSD